MYASPWLYVACVAAKLRTFYAVNNWWRARDEFVDTGGQNIPS